jgi:hypothetical protein
LAQLLASASDAACPVSPQLIQFTTDSMNSSPLHHKLWLSLYPTIQHRCNFCQDKPQWFADMTIATQHAASSFLEMEHEHFRKSHVVSIWLSAPYVFSAGSIVADLLIRAKQQSQAEHITTLTRSIIQCSSLLASYTVSLPSVRIYYEIFTCFSEQALSL